MIAASPAPVSLCQCFQLLLEFYHLLFLDAGVLRVDHHTQELDPLIAVRDVSFRGVDRQLQLVFQSNRATRNAFSAPAREPHRIRISSA